MVGGSVGWVTLDLISGLDLMVVNWSPALAYLKKKKDEKIKAIQVNCFLLENHQPREITKKLESPFEIRKLLCKYSVDLLLVLNFQIALFVNPLNKIWRFNLKICG